MTDSLDQHVLHRELRSALMERDRWHRELTDPLVRTANLESVALRYVRAEQRVKDAIEALR